jgi:hypothetical protein
MDGVIEHEYGYRANRCWVIGVVDPAPIGVSRSWPAVNVVSNHKAWTAVDYYRERPEEIPTWDDVVAADDAAKQRIRVVWGGDLKVKLLTEDEWTDLTGVTDVSIKYATDPATSTSSWSKWVSYQGTVSGTIGGTFQKRYPQEYPGDPNTTGDNVT